MASEFSEERAPVTPSCSSMQCTAETSTMSPFIIVLGHFGHTKSCGRGSFPNNNDIFRWIWWQYACDADSRYIYQYQSPTTRLPRPKNSIVHHNIIINAAISNCVIVMAGISSIWCWYVVWTSLNCRSHSFVLICVLMVRSFFLFSCCCVDACVELPFFLRLCWWLCWFVDAFLSCQRSVPFNSGSQLL